jgi:hypothetical protein
MTAFRCRSADNSAKGSSFMRTPLLLTEDGQVAPAWVVAGGPAKSCTNSHTPAGPRGDHVFFTYTFLTEAEVLEKLVW